ncbi:hypothetical protein BEP19_12335 [Ammoniphilus oxalaticus]|uniref:Uncharacterized protein n=1 Tax=Ammoniphilus oxalaticus TaxID=66863 RepID=A0A419SGU1_9BACL|nr:hypothetical protein [Ammoniphilus oxalaticus]RKD23012.1 hypothetical protein BEP19_12335 [Ammoniphilus oxalaticus]
MSTARVLEERIEETPVPVKEVKKDNVVQKKLLSIIFVWVAFAVLYLAVASGNDTFMWAGLGLLAATIGNLYVRH